MILLFITLAFMQSDTQQSALAGVVMKFGTVVEQTLPNARLELTGGPGTPLIARTDAGGRFLFSNLAAGRYRLSVTKDGFIRKQSGLIVLRDRQQIRDIVFRLEQAPTVQGWVQDAYGEPVVGAIVQALRRAYDIRGNRTLAVAASALTDDRGEYRIFWLDPGEYFFFTGSSSSSAVAPSYYPGVTDPEGAKPLTLGIGRELNGLNFRLARAGMTPVAGYVTSAVTGRPVVASVTLVPSKENPNPSSYQAQSSPQGTFAFSRPLPPGSYIASARAGGGEVLRTFASVNLRATLFPLPYDLRLTLNPDVAISGRFVSDTDSLPDLVRTVISLTPSGEVLPSPAPATPQADGQFRITGVTAGTYLLSVSDLPGDIYVKAARDGLIDVLEKQLTVTRQAPTLQILLGSDGGRISVGVVDRDNRPFGGAGVVLVPDAARRHRPDQYRMETSEEDGRATIRGIAPGEYKLFAWETLEPNAHLNPDFLRNYEALGVLVRVMPGVNPPLAVRSIREE